MLPDNSDAPPPLQKVLRKLAATIRTLPEAQQLDAFLSSCASLLETMNTPAIRCALTELRRRFPDADNEILTLIEGHLALRELRN
jgi:hypothetical protein